MEPHRGNLKSCPDVIIHHGDDNESGGFDIATFCQFMVRRVDHVAC